MSDFNLSLLQPILKSYTKEGRTALIPALLAAQEIYGYLPKKVTAEIAKALHTPLSEVYGVIDFYSLLYRKPVGTMVVHVCNDPVCGMAGSDNIFKMLTKKRGGSVKPEFVTVESVPCLGLCEFSPAMLVQGAPVVSTSPLTWRELFNARHKKTHTHVGGDINLITSNLDLDRTVWLEDYKNRGGYIALEKALQMDPSQVINEVKNSGLLGRGGAAFPTGLKWESAFQAQGTPKYVVCNADEAEPGTFKDRVMLENDPHRILEGILIAGYAVGANKGYIYIRGEYNFPAQVIAQAIKEAEQAGFLGNNIYNSEFNFTLEIRRGAGAYICGEETALFESIEGKRGFPRIKPPFPTISGLFGKPTVINNVETLCNIPLIITNGASQYRQIGTEKSSGSKLFCLSGDIAHPGLYEVPFGTSFRHLLVDLAGGTRQGHQFQAALFGGAAGAFATQKDLDVNLSFEDLRENGLALGSGVITVFDETRDLRDILLRLTRFFADESCGKCYPCQIGTQRQYEIIERIAKGRGMKGDIERLQDIATTMNDASICGLGQSASMAVQSAISHWSEMFYPGRKKSKGEII